MVYFSMLTANNLSRWAHRFNIHRGTECWGYSTHPDSIGIGVYQRVGLGWRFRGSLLRSSGTISTPPGGEHPDTQPFNTVIGAIWKGHKLPEGYTVSIIKGPSRALKFLLVQDGVKGVADTPAELNWDDVDDCAGFTVAIGYPGEATKSAEIGAVIADIAPVTPDGGPWRVTSVMDGYNRVVGGYETPADFVRSRVTAIWRAGWYFTRPPRLTLTAA